MNKFEENVQGALDIAYANALEKKHLEVTPAHLLLGMAKNPSLKCSKAIKKESKKIQKILETLPQSNGDVSIEQLRASSSLSEWITHASSHAIQNGRKSISEEDLLKFIGKFSHGINLNFNELQQETESEEEKTPTFLVNLNELAIQGKLDPVIGRTKEIRAVMEILGRRSKNNPILLGPAGVGKTAIVEGLAEAIEKGDVPDILKGKTVYSLDLGQLMAGTKFRGEFEERIQSLLKYIKGKAGQAILFIDEIHQIVGAGKTDGAMDGANLLKPALARGDLRCIGATTQEEFQKYVMVDPALERRFRPVPVDEPSTNDAIEILMGVKEKLEIHHGMKILDEAIAAAVTLSKRYITNKYLPDKAIDLIDEASSALKLSAQAMPADLVELKAEIRGKKILAQIEKDNEEIQEEISRLETEFNAKKDEWDKKLLTVKKVSELKNQLDQAKFEYEQAEREQNYEQASKLKYSVIPQLENDLSLLQHDWELGKAHVAEVIARQTSIPVEKILQTKQSQILEIGDFLKSKVFGQDQQLAEISEVLQTGYAGLSEINRPLGSFLLLGPSGVGKTETAKAITEFLFGDQSNFIRMDLSEFSEKHSVAKLIGAPAGYVGYDEGGILTEQVRKKPYSVILFDEVEKAHPDFSDILLQILDDGRLTDNKGRTISFRDTIIFLTSNSKNIERDFKPEVLGRIDAKLTYNNLSQSVLDKIVERQVLDLNEKLKSKKLKISLDEGCTKALSKLGHDERYGARPLRSQFQKFITRPLSQKILRGDLEPGELHVKWDETSGQPLFQ